MARSITLTLGAGLGADLGPNFNLTANVGSVTPSTATKSELTAGKSVSVDDAATQVTITSTGTCTNAITQTIPCAGGTTTTTTAAPTTTTTTTTAAPTCFNAVVTSTDPTYGASINATLCDGSSYTDNGMFGTQTICVQSISVSGGDYTNGGGCSVETSTTTTTTTTTTAASTNFLISDGLASPQE